MFHATAYKQSIENLITTYFSNSPDNANKVWISAFRVPCISDEQVNKAFQYISGYLDYQIHPNYRRTQNGQQLETIISR